ncbi:hypothetical protein [Martelella radicis]|uniref:PA14 domain-containing protein n=1 Tax=Martelella radicis TaxID=1397476 RepID=A0A7W6PCU0_9HYPH|nr:hypothetical protein [Martelella radicis]MBB4123732.1 hypothetical protein [Martelella radicis]
MVRRRFEQTLKTGDALTLWELGPIIEAAFPGYPAPAGGEIDYAFRNGTHPAPPLPCRVAFVAEMKGRALPPPTFWTRDGFYAPEGNPKIEFSEFGYTPTHKRRWLRNTLSVEKTGDYRFSVSTCGGVRLRVDDTEVVFEPYQLNGFQATEITLPLKAGENDILMHMEELFERDTKWIVEIHYLGEEEIVAGVAADAEPEKIAEVSALAAEVRPARDFFGREPFILVFDRPASFDVPVSARMISHQHDRAVLLDVDAVLRAGEHELDLGPADKLREGFHRLELTFGAGDVAVARSIDAAFLRETELRQAAETETERKREALFHAARHGAPRVGRVLSMFATDEIDPVAVETILRDALTTIEERHDCSDFSMVPLLWVWGHYRDKLTDAMRARVRRAILEWRYWIDEPGNDVMWFWSENHVLCFHVSQYIAGALFPDAIFSCSGRTGREQQKTAEDRLHRWFSSIEKHGLGEWNSSAYYPIDFIGIFGLYGWCDEALKTRCKALLDRIFLMTGLHTLKGIAAGSQGRAYDKELKAGPQTELSPFCQVAFGEGWLNSGVAALPLYCLSDYEAPEMARKAALWSKPDGIIAHYTQGHEHSGKLALYKNDRAMLSSVVEHSPGRKGFQEHVVDVRLSGHPMARLWVNHPGELDPWGTKRPSFWSGNGILPQVGQYGDTAMLIYDLGENPDVDFVHAFAERDGLDAVETDGHWLFARAGDGYVAIWASEEIEAVRKGATAGREFRAASLRSGWMVRVGGGDGRTGFKSFMAENKGAPPQFDADRRVLEVTRSEGPELALGWSEGLSVDGRPTPFTALTVIPQINWGA